ncbi:NUDIX hydrolase [Thalassobacillus sp. CUG 92003]|uniref:NUDIX hydrolase n=1 Tax=Thalassobacillus sp. CUG 92003 TaxID=2736641 RepID=UPI0015E76038|nr:NUDIX hydrolase [Thalassobacillus sp. CUG 92003]
MGYVEDLRKIVGTRPLILVGAVVVMVDGIGSILLQERTYPKGKWGLPGGLMELGESAEATAKREVWEETGLKISDLTLINVYSGPNHYTVAENGDEFYSVTVAYMTTQITGKMAVDPSESIRCAYVHPNNLPANLVQSHRTVIDDYLAL